tara:strand:- start:5803 stop:8397 length:2595 start_codon:yes stop_codon:yes gene_type:complete
MQEKNEFSTLSKGVLMETSEIAIEYRCVKIKPIHLGIALLGSKEEGSLVMDLEEMGENTQFLRESLIEIENKASNRRSKKGLDEAAVSFSKELELVLAKANQIAESFNEKEFPREKITPEHLFIALLESNEPWVKKVFEEAGSLSEDLINLMGFSTHFKRQVETFDGSLEEGAAFIDGEPLSLEDLQDLQQHGKSLEHDESHAPQSAAEEVTGSMLEKYGKNLTAMFDKLDDVIGRQEEIDSITETLLQKNKPNPILIGESGVGKTAIVEGFAKNLQSSNSILKNATIFELNLSGMIAGTKYRGEFEKRIEGVINEVKQRQEAGQNIILFIDEIHMIVGAGKVDGGNIDGGNMLKTALSKGEIKCIGATTPKEYKQSIEKDSALARRFIKVIVDEPSEKETIEILMKAKGSFEEHHNVEFSKEVIESIVVWSEKFISDENFPDKAFSILDNVGARRLRRAFKFPQGVVDCDEELRKMLNDVDYINSFSDDQDKYFEDLSKVTNKREKMLTSYLKKHDKRLTSTIDDVAESVSNKSGVPKDMILRSQDSVLKDVEGILLKDIFGQDEAVRAVCRAIKVSYFGLKEKGKPIASFLFDGPSGVGKTFLAKKLAENIFGSEKKLIKIDMSEYSTSTSAKKLTGADPGYVGHETGSVLVDAVRQNPYSVILFDEIEKSHQSAKNVLLQIMEDGVLTDGSGRKADFSNCIIIMTSNAGSTSDGTTVGLGSKLKHVKNQKAKSAKAEVLKSSFSPEFVSRITSMEFFNELEEKDLKRIVCVELDRVKSFFLKEKGIILKYTEKLLDFLIKNDTIQVGARQALNKVENDFKPKLVEFTMSKGNGVVKAISVTEKDGEIAFLATKQRKKVKLK